MKNYNLYFGKNIKELREERKWTQKQLAEKVGLSDATISDYENGKIRIYADIYTKILEAFSLDEISILREGKELIDITSFSAQGKKEIQQICEKERRKSNINAQIIKNKE